MENIIYKRIICPECALTPILRLNNLIFISECLSNHKHQSESIETFLSEKINEQDYQCQEHKSLNYFCFCKKCKKNICLDCFEYHEDHESDLVFFHKLKPKQKIYEEYKTQLQMMKKYKIIIGNLYNKIQKLKLKINELNDIINKSYDKIYSFNNIYKK